MIAGVEDLARHHGEIAVVTEVLRQEDDVFHVRPVGVSSVQTGVVSGRLPLRKEALIPRIRTARASGPDQEELQLDFSIPARQSQWIATRVSHNGGLAHTSPIYVMVDGPQFWDREQLPRLVNKRLEILDFARGRLKDQGYTASYAPGEIESLIDRIEAARRRHQDLLASQ